MKQNVHIPSAEIPENYDFRRYDQVWQRVAPGLEPYPTSKRQSTTAHPASVSADKAENADILSNSLSDDLLTLGPSPSLTSPQPSLTSSQPTSVSSVSPTAAVSVSPQALHTPPAVTAQSANPAINQATNNPAQTLVPAQNSNAASMALSTTGSGQNSNLPSEIELSGAEINPCCMGSAAAEMLDVLTGFIELEISDRRYFLALAQKSPTWAKARLKDMAAELASRVKRLAAVYYLITGSCYQTAISCEKIYIGRWCPALRERYHASACTGLNYARAADDTSDICLSKLFHEFSEDAYRHADELLAMLERSMNR